MSDLTHEHDFKLYGNHGPLDYGDELALWCNGCGRLRADIDDGRTMVSKGRLNAGLTFDGADWHRRRPTLTPSDAS